MKILVFGKDGQIGWELARMLPSLGEVTALSRKDADFSKPESLRSVVQEIKPDIIVNAVAYTAVDAAEGEERVALVINSDSPRVLAEESFKINALLVHYSTDYVFDGKKASAYKEDDDTNPLNAYGRTKLAGELAVESSGCRYYIFRTSWVYSARGKNFLLSILRLALERKKLDVVDDQMGSPTEASMVAKITTSILSMYSSDAACKSSVYHLSSDGETSWYGFTKNILKCFSENNNLSLSDDLIVTPVSSKDFDSKASRPMNSCLDTSKIQDCFDLRLPHWKDSLSAFMHENINTLQDIYCLK